MHIEKLKEWMKKQEEQRVKHKLHKELRIDIHKNVINRINNKGWLEAWEYVKKTESYGDSEMQGPHWLFVEARSIKQKMWSLNKKYNIKIEKV